MRQKRAKAYRKLMHLYSQFFGFRQPYQLLIDPETCKMAIENKFDLIKQLSTVAQGEVKPMITQCCIHALYLSGKATQPAVDLAKTFERRKCNHREAIDAEDCLKDVVGDSNKHRYVIVTQSQPLRNLLRKIPATPLIHINRSVMILEPPSDATLRAKHLLEQKNLGATSSSDIKLVKETQPEEAPKKKKKGPKGPNPLSVKKKKVESVQSSKGSSTKPKSTPASGKRTNQNEERHAELGKRKRDAGEDEGGGGGEEQTLSVETRGESSSKKRKRRRKAKSADVEGASAQPVDDSQI